MAGALVLAALISIVVSMPSPDPVGMKIFGAAAFVAISAAVFACMLRFGLLSVIGGLFLVNLLRWAPLTWDFSNWYAGAGLLTLGAVLVVALWAFYVSLAGQRLFRDSLLGG